MSIKLMTKAWELDLKAIDKLVLLALSDHANDDGECYPSLRKIEQKTGLSKQGLLNSIARLMEYGYIGKEYRTRQDGSQTSNLYSINLDRVVNEVDRGSQRGGQGVVNDVDRVVNEVDSNNHHINHHIEPSSNTSLRYIVEEVVSYLNIKINSDYKATSKETITLVKARLKEGFTVEDFKTVIDKKVLLWAKDIKMQSYLRPSTLFGTKFEGYLNEIVSGARVAVANGIMSEKSAKALELEEWTVQ